MFRVGQKVAVVNADNQFPVRGEPAIERGEIYTIRETFTFFGVEAVRLVEIRNNADRGFLAYRFRPIVERKTDISIFEEILRRESMPDECAPVAVYGVDWGASA